MRQYIIILVFLLGSFKACAINTYSQTPSSLSFKLVDSFGSKNGELILSAAFYLNGPVTDSKFNLYVLDGGASELLSLNSDGKIRWRTGKPGRGPGDFAKPQGLAIEGDFLYTANVEGSRIDKFDTKGNYIKSFNLDNEKTLMKVEGFSSPNHLVLTSPLPGKLGNNITIFNIEGSGKIVSQFSIDNLEDLNMGLQLSSQPSVYIQDSLIISGNLSNYSINFFDEFGRSVNKLERNFGKITRPGYSNSGSSRSIRDHGFVSPAFQINNSFYLVFTSWPENVKDADASLKSIEYSDLEFKNSIDLFDSGGTFILSIETNGQFSEVGQPVHIDQNGYLFTIKDDLYPQIHKYQIIVSP